MSESTAEILEKMRKYVSNNAFSQEYGSFPIQKFKKILENGQKLQSQELTLYSKYYGFPEVKSSEIISDCVNVWVGQCLLGNIIAKCNKEEIQTQTEKEYWESLDRIKKRLRASELTPIILLDNQIKPAWVYKKIEALKLSPPQKEKGQRNFYGYLDGVPVFFLKDAIPPNRTLIIAEESFHGISKNLDLKIHQDNHNLIIKFNFFTTANENPLAIYIHYKEE
jgi:hypothetical protein